MSHNQSEEPGTESTTLRENQHQNSKKKDSGKHQLQFNGKVEDSNENAV
jgi:hypothetical protein